MEENIQFNVHHLDTDAEEIPFLGFFNLKIDIFLNNVSLKYRGTEEVSTVVQNLDVEDIDYAKAVKEIDDLNLTEEMFLIFFKFQEKSFSFRLKRSTPLGEKASPESFLDVCIDLLCNEIES